MHVNRRALENLSNLGVIFVGALSCLIQCSLSVFISQVRISSSLKQHFHNLNENELKIDICVSVRETHIRSAKRRRVMEAATLVTLVHISSLKFGTGMKQPVQTLTCTEGILDTNLVAKILNHFQWTKSRRPVTQRLSHIVREIHINLHSFNFNLRTNIERHSMRKANWPTVRKVPILNTCFSRKSEQFPKQTSPLQIKTAVPTEKCFDLQCPWVGDFRLRVQSAFIQLTFQRTRLSLEHGSRKHHRCYQAKHHFTLRSTINLKEIEEKPDTSAKNRRPTDGGQNTLK